MRTIFSTIVLLTWFLLSGCAQTIMTKDGMTPQGFQTDHFDCEQKVMTMYGGYANAGLGHAIAIQRDFIMCMQAKGYREATTAEVTAARGR